MRARERKWYTFVVPGQRRVSPDLVAAAAELRRAGGGEDPSSWGRPSSRAASASGNNLDVPCNEGDLSDASAAQRGIEHHRGRGNARYGHLNLVDLLGRLEETDPRLVATECIGTGRIDRVDDPVAAAAQSDFDCFKS